MSFVYYSSGERDEETNEYVTPAKYIPSGVVSFTIPEQEQKSSEKKVPFIELPLELQNKYYIDKRNRYLRHTHEYWDWDKLRYYASKVSLFYPTITKLFLNTFAPDMASNFPEWARNGSSKVVEIDPIVESMNVVEGELVRQFYHFRERSVIPQFNKHSTLRRVQSYGAEAWMMFHALRGDIPVKTALKFKSKYDELNLDEELDQLLAYRGCIVLKRQLSLYVKSDMLTTSGHGLQDLYTNLDSRAVYDNLMKKIGAFTTRDYDDIIAKVKPNLLEIAKNDAKMCKLLEFYDNFDNIMKITYDLKHITKELVALRDQSYFPRDFSHTYSYIVNDRDYFELANRWLVYLKRINCIDTSSEVIKYDIDTLFNRLEDAIIEATPWHYLCHEAKSGEQFDDNPAPFSED